MKNNSKVLIAIFSVLLVILLLNLFNTYQTGGFTGEAVKVSKDIATKTLPADSLAVIQPYAKAYITRNKVDSLYQFTQPDVFSGLFYTFSLEAIAVEGIEKIQINSIFAKGTGPSISSEFYPCGGKMTCSLSESWPVLKTNGQGFGLKGMDNWDNFVKTGLLKDSENKNQVVMKHYGDVCPIDLSKSGPFCMGAVKITIFLNNGKQKDILLKAQNNFYYEGDYSISSDTQKYDSTLLSLNLNAKEVYTSYFKEAEPEEDEFTFGDSESTPAMYSSGCDCVPLKDVIMYLPPTAKCGNNKIEGKEDCDGTSLNSQTCATKGFSGGSLTCANNCKFETSNCKTIKTSVPILTPSLAKKPTKTIGGTDKGHEYNLPTGCQLICPVDVCAAKSKK